MECYDKWTRSDFDRTLEKLHEYACSRTFGLGTRLPWDEEWLIESLSDSTIYMAYYTVAHLLQGEGNIEGTTVGPLGIAAKDLTHAAWDYVFAGAPYVEGPIPEAKLQKMRHEFNYFYPLDLRVSGKDLVPNHLSFMLYNHTAIFPPNLWPKSIRANGHLLLNGEKMSKSTGNFLTLVDAIANYTADVTRIGLADAGDSLDDANFEEKSANATILKVYSLLEWITDIFQQLPTLRTGPMTLFADKLFLTEINHCITTAHDAYDKLLFRAALKAAFFDMQATRQRYVQNTDTHALHRDLAVHYITMQCLLLCPIAPHFAEHIWAQLGHPTSVMQAAWPTAGVVDFALMRAGKFLEDVVHEMRLRMKAKIQPVKPKKGETVAVGNPAVVLTAMQLFVTKDYPPWQHAVLTYLHAKFLDNKGILPENVDIMKEVKDVDVIKPVIKKVMAFVSFVKEDVAIKGLEALETVLPFDEMQLFQEQSAFLAKTLGLEKVYVANVAECSN